MQRQGNKARAGRGLGKSRFLTLRDERNVFVWSMCVCVEVYNTVATMCDVFFGGVFVVAYVYAR